MMGMGCLGIKSNVTADPQPIRKAHLNFIGKNVRNITEAERVELATAEMA